MGAGRNERHASCSPIRRQRAPPAKRGRARATGGDTPSTSGTRIGCGLVYLIVAKGLRKKPCRARFRGPKRAFSKWVGMALVRVVRKIAVHVLGDTVMLLT